MPTLVDLPLACTQSVPSAKALYDGLMNDDPDRDTVAAFLRHQIDAAAALPIDLPDDLGQLDAWSRAHVTAVGDAYLDYLEGRKAGGPRRYFTCRSHALNFIRGVAPTKLVDGAWLYGLLADWDKPAARGLIRTYLEELGDGVPAQNHVVLYQKLLASNDCEDIGHLSDAHYLQGAIQLALAHGAPDFLPEIVGYNLGYEQLPLHLLICGYELNELGIDPYYFTLHVTIDNADNGHARKAIAAITQLAPALGDADAYAQRVRDGYRLNDLGASTLSVIADFDLDSELLAILAAKSVFGKNMHSDYCRVAGRSINDWLSQPEDIPFFLSALVKADWIRRGEPAVNSRFWQLVQGPRAAMFGVFNAYELQVLEDWITLPITGQIDAKRVQSHRARQQMTGMLADDAARPPGAARRLIRQHGARDELSDANELRQLEQRIGEMPNKAAAMQALQAWMTPQRHFTPLGLMATRMYARLLEA
jgi:hypothetical protein